MDNFESGARRDDREGKGRYDLIPPAAMRRVALVYERGGAIYGDRNWEKGIPQARLLDSAKRHVEKYQEGMRDEDHLGQAVFNLLGMIHNEEMIKRGLLPESLADLPNHVEKPSAYGPQGLPKRPCGGSDTHEGHSWLDHPEDGKPIVYWCAGADNGNDVT